MAAATSASTMSLLPISQLKQQRHGAVVVFRRGSRDARRRRYVVPVRDRLDSAHLLREFCFSWASLS